MGLTSAWLGWRSVRHRPGSVLGATIVLVISTALVSALAFNYYSADHQVPTVERYTAVPMVVTTETSGGGVPLTLADDLEALPEVGEVIPEVTFPATLLDEDGRGVVLPGTENSLGHGWGSAGLTPFEVSEGQQPSTGGEIVVDQRLARETGLSVGDSATVLAAGLVDAYQVVGIASPVGEVEWRYQSAIFFTDEAAGRLRGMGEGYASALGIAPSDGVTEAELESSVRGFLDAEDEDRFALWSGLERGEVEGNGSARNDARIAQSNMTFIMWVLIVSTGVVAGAVGLSVRSRSREIALLRAIGSTPRQVRFMMAGETAVLSAVALLIGLPAGMALAGWLASGGLGLESNLSASFQVYYTFPAFVMTVVYIAASAQAAGLVAARRALRIRPSDALSEGTSEGRDPRRGRIAAGFVAVGGTVAGAAVLAIFSPPEDTIGLYLNSAVLVSALIAVGLLAPWLVRGATNGVYSLLRGRVGGVLGLSMANVSFYHRRFTSVATPLLLGITLAGVAGSTQMYFNWSAGESGERKFAADLMVISVAEDGFSEMVRAEVEGLPSVDSAMFDYVVPVDVRIGGDSQGEMAASVIHGDASEAVNLDIIEGDFNYQDDGTVIISVFFAEANNVWVGDQVSLASGASEMGQEFRVSGVYGTGGFLDRSVTLSQAAAESVEVTPRIPGRMFVAADSTAGVDGARHDIEGMFPVGYEDAPYEIYDRDSIRQFASDRHADLNGATSSSVVLVGVFLVLGAVNSVSVFQFDRKREFASMRMLGVSWRQTYRVVAVEVVITIVMLFAVAALMTLWIAALISLQQGTQFLSVLPEILPVGTIAALGGVALLFALIGTLSAVRSLHKESG